MSSRRRFKSRRGLDQQFASNFDLAWLSEASVCSSLVVMKKWLVDDKLAGRKGPGTTIRLFKSRSCGSSASFCDEHNLRRRPLAGNSIVESWTGFGMRMFVRSLFGHRWVMRQVSIAVALQKLWTISVNWVHSTMFHNLQRFYSFNSCGCEEFRGSRERRHCGRCFKIPFTSNSWLPNKNLSPWRWLL